MCNNYSSSLSNQEILERTRPSEHQLTHFVIEPSSILQAESPFFFPSMAPEIEEAVAQKRIWQPHLTHGNTWSALNHESTKLQSSASMESSSQTYGAGGAPRRRRRRGSATGSSSWLLTGGSCSGSGRAEPTYYLHVLRLPLGDTSCSSDVVLPRDTVTQCSTCTFCL